MEDFFHSVTKLLAHNIVVHVYSLPNFSIETFVASLICVVHFLLILEVNSLVAKVVARSSAKFKRRPIKDDSKGSSKMSIQSSTSKMQQHVRQYFENKPCFMSYHKKLSKLGPNSPYGWIISPSLDDKYDKIDEILSVSPSEYVRRDKEKRVHENELKHCLKSLTTLLECSGVTSKVSNSSLQKSIDLIKDRLHSSSSNKDILNDEKNITQSLYEVIENSITIKDDLVSSHGDVACSDITENVVLDDTYVNNSTTNSSVDLDSHTSDI